MGIFDLIKSGAAAAHGELDIMYQEVQDYKERYENLDDDFLKRKFRQTSKKSEKMALAQLLKERGY